MVNLFKFPHNWRSFYGIKKNIIWFFNAIGYAYQRATKGFSSFDVWDLNNYLEEVISESLFFLARNAHGYPTYLMSEISGEDEEKADEARAQAWKDKLLYVASCFKEINTFNDSFSEEEYQYVEKLRSLSDDPEGYEKVAKEYRDFLEYKRRTYNKKLEVAFIELKNVWPHLWD